jgi:hypothetical protein
MSDFKTMDETIGNFFPKVGLVYCDKIAHLIKTLLPAVGDANLKMSAVQNDLHPIQGYILSTQKTIDVEYLGRKYLITIAEAE